MTDISQVKRAKKEGNSKELQIIKLKDIRDKIQCLLNAIENDASNLNSYNIVEAGIILKDMLYHRWGLPSQVIKQLLKDFGFVEMWAIPIGRKEGEYEFFLTEDELFNWLKENGYEVGKEYDGYWIEQNDHRFHVSKQWISQYSDRN